MDTQEAFLSIGQVKAIFEDKLAHTIEENYYCGEEEGFDNTLKELIKQRILDLFEARIQEVSFSHYLDLISRSGPKLLDHSINTSIYAVLMALAMYFDDERLGRVFMAAILHDIGKTTTCEEADIETKDHVMRGVEFLKRDRLVDESVLRMISEHHEKADGSGMPNHLSKEELLLESRVIALADHYDYFLNRSSNLFSDHKNISKISSFFGQDLVAFLKKRFVPYPLSTLVRLSDNRIGVVEKLNPKDLFRPLIKIVKQIATKISIVEVDLLKENELFIIEVLEETPNPSVQSYLVKGYN